MKLKYILLMVLFNICLTQTYRDIPDVVTKVGTSVGNWLKLETDARAVGMGGAQVAAGEGVSALSKSSDDSQQNSKRCRRQGPNLTVLPSMDVRNFFSRPNSNLRIHPGQGCFGSDVNKRKRSEKCTVS